MKVRNTLYRIIYLAGSVLLLLSAAEAQIVFKRNPTNRVTQPTPPPQEQPAQTRRGDDQAFQTPQQERVAERPRIPDAIIQAQTRDVPDANRPMKGPPYIFASPSQVRVKPGENYGYTAIMWDGGEKHPYAEVWKQVGGGAPEFVLEKGRGQTGAQIELGKTYTFILTDDKETLDTITVTATREIIGDLPGGVIKRPGRDVENNMVTLVTDARTEPRNNGVVIGFFAPANSSPNVEVGSRAPKLISGRFSFPADSSLGGGSAAVSSNIKKVGVKANTYHKFALTLPINSSLEPGTQHWFIITGQNPGGEPSSFQTTGSFTTASQTVRIVFETIKIVNSSDDDDFLSGGAGEIDLWFWVNRSQPTEHRFKIQNLNNNSAYTNHFYDLKRHEFVIEGAPNSLVLDVLAKDDDTFAGQSNDDSDYYPSGTIGPGKLNDDYEHNAAADNWDLGRFSTKPGETYRQRFKLVSKPNGGDKGNLSFEIHGYWEVMRRN